MKIRKGINFIGALLLMAATSIFPATSVMAASSSYDVTFKCATTDQKVTFENEGFKAYQVVDETGTAVNGFAEVTDTGDEAEYALALKAYVNSHPGIEPVKRFTTNAAGEGKASFRDGTYLILGDTMKIDGYTYDPVPFVLKISSKMESSLTSYVKYDTTEPKPTPGKTTEPKKGKTTKTKTVKTGDTARTNVYLMLAGASVLVIGMAVAERRRKSEE